MGIELVISGVVVIISFWVASRKKETFLNLPLPKIQEEPLSVPAQFRRIQQALKSQYLEQAETQKELQYQQREVSIANQYLDVREKGLSVNEDILKLKELGLDLTEREQILAHGFRMLELSNKEFSIKQKGLELSAQATRNEIEKRLLRLTEVGLQNKAKEVALNEQENRIGYGHRLLSLIGMKLNLQKERLDINDYHNTVKHEKRMIELGKGELALGFKELENAYQSKSMELRKILSDINYQMRNLSLEKKSFGLFKERQSLDLYHNKLNNLKANITEMYNLKMEALHLEAREKSLDNREERLKLQRLYDRTQSKLSEISLRQQQLSLDKKELDSRKSVLSFIGKMW